MTKPTLHIVVVVILLGLVPLVPKMIALRTRVLHALHLNRLANWHDRNAATLVVVVRAIIVCVAVVVAVIGFSG